MSYVTMCELTSIGSSGKKTVVIVGAVEGGDVLLPLSFLKSSTISLCAMVDGVVRMIGVGRKPADAYVPGSWLAKEFPETTEGVSKIVERVALLMASPDPVRSTG